MLGVGPDDYVRPSAQLLSTRYSRTRCQARCQVRAPPNCWDLGTSIPCVLTASDAATVKATVNVYNFVIELETYLHGGAVVDIHSLVDQIYAEWLQGQQYDLDGRLFRWVVLSRWDSSHQYRLRRDCQQFIETMNGFLGAHIPPADIDEIFKNDPLAKYIPPTQ